jgi:predicted RNA binding protein YcfA (HicA-like mRNA interferase family)
MPGEVRYGEVKRMLEAKGYFLRRTTGSHHIFKKEGATPITIPVHHGKVKPVYVSQIKKLP